MAGSGDAVLLPEPVPEAFLEGFAATSISHLGDAPPGAELVGWGQSPAVEVAARRAGLAWNGPPAAAVREANARPFGHRIEVELGIAIDGAELVGSRAEFERRASRLDRWVLKAAFGTAGRNRILRRGSAIEPRERAWIERAVASGEPLLLEPWLDRVEDFGIQGEVDPAGAARVLAVTGLLSGPTGVYGGTVVGIAAPDPRLEEVALEVGRRLASIGYRGPYGVDAFTYRAAGGDVRLRPLVEINARWTMGRLALALGPGRWLHGAPPLPPGGRATSPPRIGGRPCRRTSAFYPA